MSVCLSVRLSESGLNSLVFVFNYTVLTFSIETFEHHYPVETGLKRLKVFQIYHPAAQADAHRRDMRVTPSVCVSHK